MGMAYLVLGGRYREVFHGLSQACIYVGGGVEGSGLFYYLPWEREIVQEEVNPCSSTES